MILNFTQTNTSREYYITHVFFYEFGMEDELDEAPVETDGYEELDEGEEEEHVVAEQEGEEEEYDPLAPYDEPQEC